MWSRQTVAATKGQLVVWISVWLNCRCVCVSTINVFFFVWFTFETAQDMIELELCQCHICRDLCLIFDAYSYCLVELFLLNVPRREDGHFWCPPLPSGISGLSFTVLSAVYILPVLLLLLCCPFSAFGPCSCLLCRNVLNFSSSTVLVILFVLHGPCFQYFWSG